MFGKPEDDIENELDEVLEYKVVELSGTDRSYPIVSDDFFDLGFELDNHTNGRIIADEEANITLDVPHDVMIIADLEKLRGDKSSSNDNRNSVFVQRIGDQYKISLLPPAAGEYILHIYAKRRTDSGISYPVVMQFNVTALSGTDRSYPIVSDDFFDLGFELDNHTNGRIIADEEANITLDVPHDVMIIADLEKLRGDKSSSNDNRNSVFVQRIGDQYKISLLPPAAGEYILHIYAKRRTDSGISYPAVMQFNVTALSGTDRSYPEIFADFQEMGAYLYYPLTDKITAGQNQSFKIRLQDAEKVAVICGDSWNYLTKTGDIFQGDASIKKGNVDVAVKLPGRGLYNTLIRYEAI